MYKAYEGDIGALYIQSTGMWELVEVVIVDKTGRVEVVSDKLGKLHTIRTLEGDRIMIAHMSKLNKKRALDLLFDQPKAGFVSWEEARQHILPAMLREGEETGSHA